MCRRQLIPLLALALVLVALAARPSQAQWQVDGAPVSTAANAQSYPGIISDGSGGAILVWGDSRNGTYDIYVQRVDAAGVPQWTADGVALCTFAYDQDYPKLVSDGAGGAIVVWEDRRTGINSHIYAQRVDAAGTPQWTADGVAICTVLDYQEYPRIVSDGVGGAIVIWGDYRPGTSSHLFAQRVNAFGVPQWATDGVAICTVGDIPISLTIASDDAQGAIVTWFTNRSVTNSDIFAQRVDAAGVPQWGTDGVAICTSAGNQEEPTIASDDAGGAIVTWFDLRSGNYDIYAQRVDAAGAPQWIADGVPLCTATNGQKYPTIVPDGAGGAITTWADYRAGAGGIYAQRVDAAGTPQWTADGVALCTAAQAQEYPTIVPDGAGGAMIAWEDHRFGNLDIYAQWVDAAGVPQWTTDGVPLCTAADDQEYPLVVSDGAGGAMISWEDHREEAANADVYVHRVYGAGGVADVPPHSSAAHFQLLPPSPNPSRDGQLTIRFNLSSSGRVSAQVVDLAGHRVRTLATEREFSPGIQMLGWDGRNDAGVRLPSGVYFVEVRVGTHSDARRVILLR